MLKAGWSILGFGKKHYFTKGKKTWLHYPPEGSSEGYFVFYKSLCGKDEFCRKPLSEPELLETLPSKKEFPCMRCLLLLARTNRLV